VQGHLLRGICRLLRTRHIPAALPFGGEGRATLVSAQGYRRGNSCPYAVPCAGARVCAALASTAGLRVGKARPMRHAAVEANTAEPALPCDAPRYVKSPAKRPQQAFAYMQTKGGLDAVFYIILDVPKTPTLTPKTAFSAIRYDDAISYVKRLRIDCTRCGRHCRIVYVTLFSTAKSRAHFVWRGVFDRCLGLAQPVLSYRRFIGLLGYR
jgi:hypothetical protein